MILLTVLAFGCGGRSALERSFRADGWETAPLEATLRGAVAVDGSGHLASSCFRARSPETSQSVEVCIHEFDPSVNAPIADIAYLKSVVDAHNRVVVNNPGLEPQQTITVAGDCPGPVYDASCVVLESALGAHFDPATCENRKAAAFPVEGCAE